MKKNMLMLVLAVMLIVPAAVFGADKLIVKDSGANTKFTARDDGSIMLNTAIWDAPTWVKIYGATDGNITGLSLDSYGNGTVMGGGGLFRFARGTQAAKAAVQNGDRLGFFAFASYDGTAFSNSAALTAKIDGPVSTGVTPTKFSIETGSSLANRTERMVISSAGNVGIAQASPTHLLQVGVSYSDGGAWVNGSSRAFKDNIETLSAKQAIDTVKSLTPVTYVYKTTPEQGHVGFIAEDVPALVATKDRKGLSSMDIVAVVTKVVQEQEKTIESLSDTVAKLEAKLNNLESKGMSARK